MDKRKENKGTVGNKGGRPSKAEEQKLVEKLSPLEDNAHKSLKDAVNAGEKWAIELFFKYMYGLPKQSTDITTNGESINKVVSVDEAKKILKDLTNDI